MQRIDLLAASVQRAMTLAQAREKALFRYPVYKHLNLKYAERLVEHGEIKLGYIEEFATDTNAGRADRGEASGRDIMHIGSYQVRNGIPVGGDVEFGRRGFPKAWNLDARNNVVMRMYRRPDPNTALVYCLSKSKEPQVGQGLSTETGAAPKNPNNCCVEFNPITLFLLLQIRDAIEKHSARLKGRRHIAASWNSCAYIGRDHEDRRGLPHPFYWKEKRDEYQQEVRLVFVLDGFQLRSPNPSVPGLLTIPQFKGCGRIIQY